MLNDNLISKPEAARLLGISKFTINAWVSQRRIPFIKLGRRVLFDPAALAVFVEKRAVPVGTA